MEKNPTLTLVVALALRGKDGRLLLHLRPEGKDHAGLWEFPGGKVEKGEIPAHALVREIDEELGIHIRPDTLRPCCFAHSTPLKREKHLVILLYTSDRWDGEPKALEGGEIGWFTPAEIAELAKPPLDVDLCRQLFKKEAD